MSLFCSDHVNYVMMDHVGRDRYIALQDYGFYVKSDFEGF